MTEEKRLTYRQIINILCILAVRQERITEALLEFGEQQKFQTFELLKAETKIENYSKKIFYQKVRELENSHQGLVNWIHEQLYKENKKPTRKDTIYIYSTISKGEDLQAPDGEKCA